MKKLIGDDNMKKGILIGVLVLVVLINGCMHESELTDDSLPEVDQNVVKEFEESSEAKINVIIDVRDKSQVDDILDDLSKNEFEIVGFPNLGGSFSGHLTKKGFEKLSKDSRIKGIYPNVMVSGADNPWDIAIGYCKSQYGDNEIACKSCAFQESIRNIDELRSLGFNCMVSKDTSVLEFDTCKCEGMLCIPEKEAVYYIIGDKLEAVFKVKPYAEEKSGQVTYPYENICL